MTGQRRGWLGWDATRSAAATGIVLLAAIVVILGGLAIGTRPLSPRALMAALLWPDGKINSIFVWTLRLPRSLAAFLGGVGLGVSGYLLQTLTRNPLAGPAITGVMSGAVTPIVFCFVFLPWLSSIFYPLIGMAGGLAAALVTFWIARGARGRPLHLALGGISVSLLLGAITTYILILTGPQVPSLLFWLAGGFQGRTWLQLAYMTPWVVLGTAGALACHRVLGLLTLSEEAAAGMGLQLAFWKPFPPRAGGPAGGRHRARGRAGSLRRPGDAAHRTAAGPARARLYGGADGRAGRADGGRCRHPGALDRGTQGAAGRHHHGAHRRAGLHLPGAAPGLCHAGRGMTAAASASFRRAGAAPWFLPTTIVIALLSLVAAVLIGVVDIPPADTLAALTGHGSSEARSIILDIRLPRIVTGMLAGIHFAVAGLLLQTITRNPLADPSIMGVSQGATLTVTVFLLLTVYVHIPGSNTLAVLPLEWMPAVAMLGGLMAGAVIYLLAFRHDLGPLRVTICGIAVGAVLHAVAIGLIAGWGSARLEVLLEWLSGSLYARSWEHAFFLLPFTVAGLVALPLLRRPLELLRFEAPVAQSFGLSYRLQLSLALALACALAASAVGVVGPIVFIGLIVPHLARFLAGRRFALVLPLTIVLGVIVVTLGDLVGRLAGGAQEIPIGVVTAVCGVPILIALLRREP